METNRLIAYNLLKRDIIDNNFCTSCGACEAACPLGVLRLEGEQVRRLQDCSKSADLCPICYEICPHSETLLIRSLEPVYESPLNSVAVGYLRKILLAQSKEPAIREKSHDGAVVTTLLDYGVRKGIFDSAIVSQTDEETAAKPKPTVALVSDDIYGSIGSKFFPSPVIKTYGEAVDNYVKNKIALVALPCQALALRKIDAWNHRISGKTKILLGLFCFGALSGKSFLNFIEKEYKIKQSEIKKIYIADNLFVETSKGKIGIPIAKAKEHILPGCRTCIDYTSEVADISVGSAYPLKDWSVVIIRTKAGEEFFNRALEDGVINIRNIEQEPEVFERVIVTALKKRNAGLIQASKLEKTHSFVPVRLIREIDSLADVKVEDVMTKGVRTVPSNMSVSELLTIMAKETYIGYPVLSEKNELVGIVTIEEAAMVDKDSRWKTQVGSIARQNLEVAYPGETALDVIRKMSKQETGRIIVLDPKDPEKILGIVTKRDLMHLLIKQASDSSISESGIG